MLKHLFRVLKINCIQKQEREEEEEHVMLSGKIDNAAFFCIKASFSIVNIMTSRAE